MSTHPVPSPGSTPPELSQGEGAWVAWKDLHVSVSRGFYHSRASKSNHSGRKILDSSFGFAQPGLLTAIMGPSGSGKSTLLDSLSGRLSKGMHFQGDIWLNGSKQHLHLPLGSVAYVSQEEALLGTLTVKETIAYAAGLRLPHSLPSFEKNEIIRRSILEMGLKDCADTPVGNWHLRGISHGERRRLAIAIETITKPLLLFVDEATTGLDSAAAYFVISALRNMAKCGRTLVVSIHQPSAEVFELFDNLCLLSQGKTVYFGESNDAQDFFYFAGFPCPRFRNPSDHYLHTINANFHSTKQILSNLQDVEASPQDLLASHFTGETLIDSLVVSYQASSFKKTTIEKMGEASQVKSPILPCSRSQARFLTQALCLTKRSFKNKLRDLGYYWLMIIIYSGLSFALSTIYFRLGIEYNTIQARALCLFYISGLLPFVSLGGFSSFIEDLKVFSRERLNGHYEVFTFLTGSTLSSAPFIFLSAFLSSTILYNMVNFHPGFQQFIYMVFMLYATIICVESMAMVVGLLAQNFLMGLVISAGIQGSFLLACGFFRRPSDLPKIFWQYPMSFIAFQRYTLQGLYKNEFIGMDFEDKTPMLSQLLDASFLRDYDIDINVSKWWDMCVLLLMACLYRILFLVIINARTH